MTAQGRYATFRRPGWGLASAGFTFSLERPRASGLAIDQHALRRAADCWRNPVKRTYQPHRTSRLRTHGFRARMKTANGRKVINNRRRKGRARLGISVYKK